MRQNLVQGRVGGYGGRAALLYCTGCGQLRGTVYPRRGGRTRRARQRGEEVEKRAALAFWVHRGVALSHRRAAGGRGVVPPPPTSSSITPPRPHYNPFITLPPHPPRRGAGRPPLLLQPPPPTTSNLQPPTSRGRGRPYVPEQGGRGGGCGCGCGQVPQGRGGRLPPPGRQVRGGGGAARGVPRRLGRRRWRRWRRRSRRRSRRRWSVPPPG